MSKDETVRVTASAIRDRFAAQEQSINSLCREVEILQRDRRRLKRLVWTLPVVAMVMACWALWLARLAIVENSRPPSVSPMGNPMAAMAPSPTDRLVLRDDVGRERLTLTIHGISGFDAHGGQRFDLSYDEGTDSTVLALFDRSSRSRVEGYVLRDGSPHLLLLNESGAVTWESK